MDKNENGYPVTPRMGDMGENRSGTRNGNPAGGNGYGGMSGNGCSGMGGNGYGSMGGNGCGGNSRFDEFPLSYVYAPNQNFRLLYSAEQALKHGTLFEELYKPKEVYGRE